MKPRFVIVVLLALTLMFAASYAGAQTLKKQIVGTWNVVSAVNELDGKKIGDPFGSNPQGQFIFARDGHFALFLVRPGRPKFVSNNRTAGTPEENKAAMAGFLGEFGTYTINPDGKSITLDIVACSFPNWDATHQERRIQITGDEMKIMVAAGATGTGSSVITVRRAK
jgi:hypothetical protein